MSHTGGDKKGTKHKFSSMLHKKSHVIVIIIHTNDGHSLFCIWSAFLITRKS